MLARSGTTRSPSASAAPSPTCRHPSLTPYTILLCSASYRRGQTGKGAREHGLHQCLGRFACPCSLASYITADLHAHMTRHLPAHTFSFTSGSAARLEHRADAVLAGHKGRRLVLLPGRAAQAALRQVARIDGHGLQGG